MPRHAERAVGDWVTKGAPQSVPGRVATDLAVRATVVVPTWNGARWLAPCLASLRAQTAWGEFDVVVVDNGSVDETPELLSDHPWAKVIRFPTNQGFAKAANAGISGSGAPVIVLLNNDTVAEPTWLEALLAALDAHPSAGMATSKIRMMGDRALLHTTGDTLNVEGRPGNRGVWQRDTGQYDHLIEVFGASGAAGAYRREVFDRVGIFEERFGSYLEDVDLAWRAQLAGFRCVFAPAAVVFHSVSATGGGPLASFYVARNRVWLVVRNYPRGPLRRHARAVLGGFAADATSAALAWRGAAARATLRGLAVGLISWPLMLPARRIVQSRRVLDDAAFEALLDPA